MTSAVRVSNLHWKYRDQTVLHHIDLDVPAGSVFGFIGHNGAGKTTTIKLLLQLLEAPKGAIHVFGLELQSNRRKILARVGALIEQPGIYGHLTAYQNLKSKAMLLGIGQERIEETLEIIGLKHARNKKAEKFSQGMKQRLGIGLAILHEPELLILDEPTNGLDPAGILEIRQLLSKLAEQGKTIFISSHLLSEVEKLVSHLAIIDQGRIVFQGALNKLQEHKKNTLLLEVDNYSKACQVLTERNIQYKLNEHGIVVHMTEVYNAAEINKILVFAGLDVDRLQPSTESLEELFFQLTKSKTT